MGVGWGHLRLDRERRADFLFFGGTLCGWTWLVQVNLKFLVIPPPLLLSGARVPSVSHQAGSKGERLWELSALSQAQFLLKQLTSPLKLF